MTKKEKKVVPLFKEEDNSQVEDMLKKLEDENGIEDGLYMFYIQGNVVYPIIMDRDRWVNLQKTGNELLGGPVQVINKPLGYAEKWT